MASAAATTAAEPARPDIGNIEAEAALLGAMMIDNRIVERVADRVTVEDFFEPRHGEIFAAVTREVSAGRRATPVTLRPYFADSQVFADIGGAGYLAKLTGNSAALVGWKDFAEQIRELGRRRKLRDALEQIAVTDWNRSFAEIVADAESAISDASRDTEEGTIETSAAQAIDLALAAADQPQARVRCGVEPIDTALGPLFMRDMTILAGRPSMGKTTAAQNIGTGVAAAGHGVVFFSLEMSAEQLGARIAAERTFDGREGVSVTAIASGALARNQIRRVCNARDEVADLPFQIVDTGGMTMLKLNAMVRRWKRRMAANGVTLRLVIVDYLQLMRGIGRDRVEAITEISQGLKRVAKTHDVHVLAVSQLSRAVEQREDKRPQLSDLRDSGSIEQDADNVLFVFRPEYYLERTAPSFSDPKREAWETLMNDVRGRIEFICAKRRQGEVGKTFGMFSGAFQAIRAGESW